MGEEKGTAGNGPVHDPSTCVWKAGRWECLHALDADHFYYGDQLVDLVMLRWQASSMQGRQKLSIAQIHDIQASLMMLERYALGLADQQHRYAGLVSPGKAAKYLRMANEVGLATGIEI